VRRARAALVACTRTHVAFPETHASGRSCAPGCLDAPEYRHDTRPVRADSTITSPLASPRSRHHLPPRLTHPHPSHHRLYQGGQCRRQQRRPPQCRKLWAAQRSERRRKQRCQRGRRLTVERPQRLGQPSKRLAAPAQRPSHPVQPPVDAPAQCRQRSPLNRRPRRRPRRPLRRPGDSRASGQAGRHPSPARPLGRRPTAKVWLAPLPSRRYCSQTQSPAPGAHGARRAMIDAVAGVRAPRLSWPQASRRFLGGGRQ
jgi:hypothetical protein